MVERLSRLVGVIATAVIIFVTVWALTYPSSTDPKNIKYVLWKAGLYKTDLDVATGTMVGDARRDTLVVGKSKAQLRRTFGFLLPPEETSPYLKSCYQSSAWKDADVLFIRRSPWMVVFDRDTATQLVLVKGC